MAAMETAAKKETLSPAVVSWEGVFSLAADPALPQNRVWEKSQLAENSRLGFETLGSTLRLGFEQVNSRTALGMRGVLYDEGIRSRCTGKERDSETGLDNFGARYYASNMGRFMTPDWAQEPTTVPYADFDNPQTLNLYSHTENNPTSDVDEDGHQDCHTGGMTQEQCAAFEAANNADTADDPNKRPKVPGTTVTVVGESPGIPISTEELERVLKEAQDAAMSNPNFQPSWVTYTDKSGKVHTYHLTHCNQGLCAVAKAVNAPMKPLTGKNGQPLKAEQIRQNLAKPGSGYRSVSAAEAAILANQGKFVIVAGPGHVASVRPSNIPGENPTGMQPAIANVGATNGVLGLNYTFQRSEINSGNVKFYTPQ
jgi:RHS repeat-associated protein